MNPRVLAAALGAAVVIGAAAWLFCCRARRDRPAGDRRAGGDRVHRLAPPRAAPARRSGRASPGRRRGTGSPAAGCGRCPQRPRRRPRRRRRHRRRSPGLLRIDSDVPGAQVFIDRQFVGTTPVTAENVSPGTHQLNVSAEGFDGIARTIEVEAGAARPDGALQGSAARPAAAGGAQAPDGVVQRDAGRHAAGPALRDRRQGRSVRGRRLPTSRRSRWTTRRRTCASASARASSTTSPIPTATPTSCSCSTATWTRRASAWPAAPPPHR